MKFFLEGIEANPENFLEVNYEFDLRDRKRAKLNPVSNDVTFFGEDRQRILDFVAQYSRYQGMPVTIDFEDANNTQIQMYLDFSSTLEIGDDFVNCEIVRRGSIKSFINLADGKSLSTVNWLSSDFEEIEYQIIKENQGLLFISLSLALLSLQQELAQATRDIAEGISDVQEASIPSVSAAGVPVINIPLIISASIKLAMRVAYAIFIFLALIKIIGEILDLIFPIVRTFKCMRLRTMLQRSCQDLGFTFVSNLIDQLPGATIIPIPARKKDPSWFQEVFFNNSLAFNEGYPTLRDSIKTIGDLIDFVEETFNAETVVTNGVVRIENRPYFFQNATSGLIQNENIMPDETTTVSFLDNGYKRKTIEYAIDGNDINTLDDLEGNFDEYKVDLINSPYPDIKTIKGFEGVTIPMARATNKNKLSVVEQTAKALAKAVDVFTGSNLVQKIEDRKNIMRISDQYFTVTKFAYCQGKRLHPNQNNFIGTDVIKNKYHNDLDVQNNTIQLTIGMPIGLGLDKILQLEQNNYVNLGNKVIRINYINFNDDDNDAVIDFEERMNEPNVIMTKL
jgi:hypothetical protein